jgi:hypothetical protein
MSTVSTPDRSRLITQAKTAFDLLQCLYGECAALVRELEFALHREEEQFVIGKPAGYGVSTRGSTGLNPMNVELWPMRKFAVFFAPEAVVTLQGGQTRTNLDVRSLYLRFLLDDYDSMTFGGDTLQEPTVIYGVFTEVVPKGKKKKLEEILGHIENRETSVFAKLPDVAFEDGYVRIVGTFQKVNLFDLADTASVSEHLAKPAVALYKSIPPREGAREETKPAMA